MSSNLWSPAVHLPGMKFVGSRGGAVEDMYPLTPMQQAMLLHGQRDPGLYVQQYVCTLREPVDPAELRAAWERLHDRHPVLRSSFHPDAVPEPMQVVHPAVQVPWREHDWRHLDEDEQDAAMRAFLRDDRLAPFRPEAAPLSRFALFRTEDDAYTLVWTSHHALIDGRSRRIVLREVFEDYEAAVDGRAFAPAERPSFSEYVRWTHDAEPADSRAFWEAELRGFEGANELFADAGTGGSLERERYRFELSDGLGTGLRLLAQREEVTLNTIFQGAWALLLGRYTGDDDVAFGATRMCRRGAFAGADEVVGLMTNTVPVRVRLDRDVSVRDYLDEVRGLWVRMRPHERTHLARIQEWRGSAAPLFHSLFGFETETAQEGLHRLGEGWWRRGFDLLQWTGYPLAVVAHGGDRVSIEVVYDPARFSREAIARMEGHLSRVLRAFAEDAGQPLGSIGILSPAERRFLVDGLNPRAAAEAECAPVHALLRAQAERTPDAPALEYAGGSLTYGELDWRSSQLARLLVRHGVTLESRVAVCMERSPEMVIALVAILKAGGAFVPLDPENPRDRLAFVLADAGVSLLLCDARLADRLPEDGPTRLLAEPGWAQAAGESSEPPCSRVPAHALAYVMYTSGSTGTPKGVAVEHRGIVRLVRGCTFADLGAGEVILQAAPVSFDASTLEIWGALLNGGRLVLPPAGALSLEELGRVIVRHGVSTLWLTAGLFQVMVDEQLESFAGVRQLLTGGDVVPVAQAQKIRARFPLLRLINGYGPTENTTFTCCHTVPAEWRGGPIPIGTPIGGTRVYLLDEALRPVPVGVPGELYTGGLGVGRGYVDRPGITADRFVPDPFSSVQGARMYRTGDRARWRADGTVEFLGRRDGQVKIRGLRIETGEIETALRALPGVAECVVVVREDVPGDKRLVAYVVGDADSRALRDSLFRTLPDYMVPGAFVALDRLPLNANGKVDRRALPAPERGEADAAVRTAPRTPVEEMVAGIWAQVLGVERVGVEERFFELGGHSLLAMRVLSRVREVMGVELPVRALFENPTVAAMAARVEEIRRAAAPALPPLVAVSREGSLPLSFAQERLWFLERLEGPSALYNVPVARRLAGPLDVAALERALGELVHRHEALRTVFREHDGQPVQVILPFAGFALRVEDLSGLEDAEREAARRTADDAALPFDLAAGPLFRATLLRMGAEDHLLLLCIHHAVTDGWSLGVLFRELAALYTAYRDGAAPALPAPAVQYADYAVWHREAASGPALTRQLAWWKNALSGAPELLELPTDHPRPAVRTHAGAVEGMTLDAALVSRLEALARGRGATLYMVLLGAFQALLAKYAGTDDVVVGSPVAGRTRREVEEVAGFFVNTLPLRTDLSGDPSFADLLMRVRAATLGAFDHQDVPFERLVAELVPGRSLGHAPLVQVNFVLQDASTADLRLPGVRADVVETHSGTAKFDLSLSFQPGTDGLRGTLIYSTDLFEGPTVRRMAGHLERVLRQVSADPDLPLSRLSLLDAAERAEGEGAWRGEVVAMDADACIHHAFETWARRTPDAVALIAEDASLTYAQLDERANRLANHLAVRGVGPEVRVGICMERGLEMVISLLAVLKAGGGYVPLDPAYPQDRLEYMLADSGAAVLLTQARLRGVIPARDGVEAIEVDQAWARIESASAARPAVALTPSNLAYVIYTSGSTGRPKGVMNAHGGVVNRLVWMQAEYGLGADDVVLQKTPFSFDVSVWEFFWPLRQGACLVMARPEGHRDPAYLREVIRARGVTTLHFVPSMLQQFVESMDDAASCATLRSVVCSGEALPAALVRQFHERLPASVGLHNLYGPTEAAVDVSYWPCPADAELVPIGRPVWNTQLYVLDAGMNPLPVGVPGELYIGGIQVARGYVNRASLTAEKFVPDPLAGAPGARLYRTGDKARWRTDGTLEYLGRLDDQVKIRGFRVELGEIDAVLRRHPAVRACAVVVREEGGDKRLVAYVVGDDANADALRAWLRESLPEHMVPAAFVSMPALPVTANGKLDRRALPAPEFGPAAERYVAPRTPVEQVLAQVWAAVLKLDRVGIRESFFELGGHSLLATRVASRVREALGVELPVRAMFEAPTVAELAERVDALRGRPVLPPVVPVDRNAPPPLSFAQEGLWFLHRLAEQGAAYNVPVALRMSGALDVDALENALGEIVRRHEALRTTFAEVDGSPVQVIAPFAGFAMEIDALRAVDADDREAQAGQRAAAEAARPFDLSAGPLFRATLLRLAADEHLLVIVTHHVVADGWSVDVLHRELAALYETYKTGAESVLPPLPVQYADHAAWERAQLAGDGLARQLAYWKEALRSAPELLELPTDRPRPPAPSYRGGSVPVELPAELAADLRALARREGATPFMVLMAAFQLVLGRYAGTDDVVVGTPVAGRARPEVEGLIGYFVNTLPLRTYLGGDPTFGQLLRRVREATLGAFEHQETPFERLVAELRPGRTLSYAPLFQVTLALQAGDGRGPALDGLTVRSVHTGAGTAKYDLSLNVDESGDGMRGVLTYAADLFDAATAERLAGHLRRVLEQAAQGADVRVSAMALMGEAERSALVDGWRPRESFASTGSIHGRFQAQVRNAPHAIAVTGEGEALTYAQLDAASSRVARRLRALGVGAEVRVGLCLERTPAIAVAILGVLRAGGAYVPIDPTYPEDRIAYLVQDSGVPVVIAREGTRGAVADSTARVVLLDELLADDGDDSAVSVDVHPETAAYVIYTSGSTGRPKGVVVTHANVLRLFDATDPWFGFGADDAWTFFHSYAFDFSVWEIWGALLYGGRLVVVPFAVSRDPAAFRALLARERVTVLNQTPSAFRQLVHADAEGQGELALRWVVFGGEALEPTSLLPWYDRHGDRKPRLVNMYGITETTVHVTFREFSRADAMAGGSMIGEPIPDLGVYLLDGRMEPVPPGVPGEIFVGGAGSARGYLGRPALTAERFVPDPFAGVPGARMYRSGDRARGRADGDNEYLGRADMQVKVRGFRIEPGEIEAALVAQPGVREAVVLAREDEPGVRRLVAYVVPAGVDADADASPETLRAALAERLPDYMVPAAFVAMDAIPLTPHGKVDRRALPVPDNGQLAASEYVAPSGPVEEALAAAWAQALGVERVGAGDNYFALGGDSMRAIQLMALARARGVPFSLADLFRHQTVAELAAAIRPEAAAEGDDDDASARPFSLLAPADRALVPAGVEDAYPMTRLQLGMLFHSEQHPGHAVYHNVQAYRVFAPFDEARLRGVLATMAARHPVLRTAFDLAGFSEPVQLVHARVEIPLTVSSLDDASVEERDETLRAWFAVERAGAFDWRAAPLLRFHVHTLGPDAFRLGFTEHHAILDGWSVAGFLAELFALYAGASVDEAAPAAVLPEFVALEREVLASAEANAFWARALEDSEPTLPAALGTADGEGNRLLRADVPAEVGAALAALARREGLPLKSLLLAAHLRVLSAAAGTHDVATGVVVNGRPEGGLAERALGLFLNTIPCRMRLSGGGWLQLARGVFEWERAVLPFRRYPVAELQRMRGGRPPFSSLFNFIHFHNAQPAGALRVERETSAAARLSGVGGTNFPFGVSFEAVGDDLRLTMEYDAARWSDAEADALIGRYLTALGRIAADPRGRSGDGLLSPAERALLAEWGTAEARHSSAATLDGLVAERARITPHAVAIEHAGRTLTFAQLEHDAARLARVLRGRGVGPETRVGICCSRSPELVVAWLAVLRAGGAVVPLDPAYPAARTSFILADAGVRLLLADAATAGVTDALGADTLRVDKVANCEACLADVLGAETVVDKVAKFRANDFASAADPRGAAYVIYTSGSTGTPKGVVVEHGAAAAHVAAFAGELGMNPADRVLHFAPLGFDVAVEQLFVPLAGGATAVLADDLWTPAEWPARAGDLGITVANLPPAYWLEVIAAADGARLPALRMMIIGADAMPAGAVERWRAAVRTDAELRNAYGPTETVITATTFRVPAEWDYAGAVVPVGAPLPGRVARVLDPFGAPAAPGVPGELCLGGGLLARGYLGRPGFTAERFVPDPFSAEPGARLYRTGDRVRWMEVRECESAKVRKSHGDDSRADASTFALSHSRTFALEFLGRIDQQVKVRGYRIEPGEVEAALALHPAVREAAVVARADGGERRLAAYLVAAAGAEAPSVAELRATLKERLPEYMVPSTFTWLDAFPLTPNGKLDRRALPAPDAAEAADDTSRVAPRDALELRLTHIWEELLGTAPVGVRDDFFALGGHSLAALRLLATVERATGTRLSMAGLLAAPTVEQMARALRGGVPSAAGSLVPLRASGSGTPLFLVHAAGGNAVSYAALARHLDADVPVHALQSRGLEDDGLPRASVAEMAAAYVAEIRAVQPAGPYRLGGWSMGGIVAFEMARILTAAGEAVDLLALVDSRAPRDESPSIDADDPALLAGFGLHLGLSAEAMEAAIDPSASPDARLQAVWRAACAADVVPDDLDLPRFARLWSVFQANVAASSAWRPEPASSDLLLIVAENRAAEAESEAARWRSLTRGTVRTESIPGDHFALVREPHVRALAALLGDALAPPADPHPTIAPDARP